MKATTQHKRLAKELADLVYLKGHALKDNSSPLLELMAEKIALSEENAVKAMELKPMPITLNDPNQTAIELDADVRG